MKFNLYLTSLAAVLCTSLFFSCTTNIEFPPPPPNSSSSAQTWNYCVYPEIQQCYQGSYSTCPSGGMLSTGCPFAAPSSSSLGGTASSSSGSGQSSSGAVTEYAYCVFATERMCLTGPVSSCPPSGVLSNDCPYGSSSSLQSSSSSTLSGNSSNSSLDEASSSSSDRSKYSIAAKIYFRGTDGNSFSKWFQGDKHAEGICKGYVQETLGADGKMKWKGQPSGCKDMTHAWKSETDFVNAFKSTPGQNVELCYEMPFERRPDGLWEFDAFYMCPDGSTMDYSADRQGTKGCVGHGGPGSMGGFYLPKSMLTGTPGTVYDGNRVAVKDTTKWCYDRGWYGFGIGDLNGKNTKAEIDAEMKKACIREFRQGEIEDNDDPINFEWLPTQKDVKGLLCFESAPAEFIYQPGQEFFFRGDDDIWVFINNQLVIDLGGNHMPAPGYVKLDTITKPVKLVEGAKYSLNIFFCDRRAPGSNVRIATNIYFDQSADQTCIK